MSDELSEAERPDVTMAHHDPFEGTLVARVVPTTEPQREVWLASTLSDEASLAYNESVSLRLRGPLDLKAMVAAIRQLVDRHEALRATISPDGEELFIAEPQALPVPLHDLAGLAPAARQVQHEQALLDSVNRPFDLENGPLVRAEILRLAADDHLLLLSAHHIVCDGWSFGVLVNELGHLYSQGLGHPVEELEPADSFADYAVAQNARVGTPEHMADEAFWLRCFPTPSPALDLPTDRPRTAQRSFASRRADRVLDAELVTRVRKLGALRGASLFATLLGGFAALLHRLGAGEAVVGVPSAGQSITGEDHLVGHCVNLLALRLPVDEKLPLTTLLASTQGTLLDAFEHSEYTYGTLLQKLSLQREPNRLPLVSVMFNLDQALEVGAADFPELQVDFAGNPRRFETFELSVNAVQVRGTLRLECQYNADLFDHATVERWLACYETLLASACDAPETALDRLALVSPADMALMHEWNQTARPFPRTALVHRLIEAQVARTPELTAIDFQGRTLSYRSLDERANQLAHALRAQGVARGSLVGLHIERNLEMLICMLAVLKAGAAYVPLDPAYPAARLQYMARHGGLGLLISHGALAGSLAATGDAAADAALAATPRLLLDRDAALWQGQGTAPLPDDDAPQHAELPAYVIYTSGSTGEPKGVQVPHRAVVNFLQSMAREPGLHEGDRLIAVTTLSFDIAATELLLPLTVGAQIILADRAQATDGTLLRAMLDEHRADVLQATPATWRLMLEAGWPGRSGFRALCGGEALDADLARRLAALPGELWNMYGPTETTVWSTCCRVHAPIGAISIGRPIANTSVWILDGQLQPCPIGVPGEIVIGGDGVTLGYLRRPELTAERFIADPFSEQPGASLYRTGDRGRWRPDGQLEHLGRNDFQIKLRGYRIEPGDIEAALLGRSEVARALVIAREDRAHDMRLVAYLVARDGATLDEAALKEHLKGLLPDYMLPQHIVVLPAIPLLPNGKVDRKALPAPELPARDRRARIAPRNKMERTVAAAMEQALRMPGLSIDDDFFLLGGHSLLAAHLAMRLTQTLGMSVSIRAVFDAPTVQRLAAWIESRAGQATLAPPSPLTEIPARADQGHAPVSLMQQRLWFLEQLNPGRLTYNTPSAHRLVGPLELPALERAFNEMLRRQSVLRTAITSQDGIPVQRVLPELTVSLSPLEDLSALPAAAREDRLTARLRSLADQVFELREAPLFKLRLFKLGEEEHVLFFMPHHIIWDGWSFDLFHEEMAELYGAYSGRRTPVLPALAVSYGDVAAWQVDWLRGEPLRRQLAHWKERLAQLPDPLDLPADRPRPAAMTGEGVTEPVTLDRSLVDATRQLGQQADATLFMTLLAVYATLLHRLSGQDDLIIGTPVRGRDRGEMEKLMGFFVNALPLRIVLKPELPFIELVKQVRGVVLDAFSFPDVPFEHLVRELDVPRDTSRSALFQSFFSFQDARQRPDHWGALAQRPVFVFQRGSAEDLGLWFLEHEHGLNGGLTYNTDLFSRDSALRMRERFEKLLSSAIATPLAPLAQLALLSPEESASLRRWNQTTVAYPRGATVSSLIAEQAERTPEASALQSGTHSLSYAELEAEVNQLAHELRARGTGRGQRVGLCTGRSSAMVVAQLAVLRAGAAYVPLDPAYPAQRLAYMAQDAGLSLLITESALADKVEWSGQRLLLDADLASIAERDDSPLPPDPARDARPEDPAYVIYTSGSTGQPKGVVVPHRSAVNFLCSMQRQPGLTADDRLVAVTTLSFDIAVLELLLPLTVGGLVLLASREETLDGRALRRLLEAGSATTMQATPALWRVLIDAGWQGSPRFKALVGGEALPIDLAEALLERCGELWNMYGPTETTVWSTCWRVRQPRDGILIGKPIANTAVHVLDARRQPCPLGVPGEIWIAGDGVTLGYLDRAQLTAERFVPDPFGTSFAPSREPHEPPVPPGPPGPPERGASGHAVTMMYRTGDRGRWRADGQLEHLGRLDFQVKLRGYRIELGEIEAALASHPDVARNVVTIREDRPGDVRLVAYVVPRGVMPSVATLRGHLQRDLPEYMLPQHFVALETVPLLPNGKVDRSALPNPMAVDGPTRPRFVPPANAAEQALVVIWSELLDIGQISVQDNFFEIGGHSLLALQMFARIEKHFGVNLPLSTLLRYQTIRALATLLHDASTPPATLAGHGHAHSPGHAPGQAPGAGVAESEDWRPLVALRRGGALPPLFCIHAVGGNVLNYRVLAAAMPAEQPVYGLQAIGLDGRSRPLDSIAEMARRYCEEVRREQPQGPYFLCGGSLGGTVAFEMACQFEQAGQQVGLVGLLDTQGPGMRSGGGDAPIGTAMAWGRRALGATLRGQWRRVAGSLFWRGRAAVDAVFARWYWLQGRAIPHQLRWRLVEAANRRANANHAERPYAGPVVLFRAVDEIDHVGADGALGWRGVISGPLEIIELPGTHREFIEQPDLANALRNALGEAQRRAAQGAGSV